MRVPYTADEKALIVTLKVLILLAVLMLVLFLLLPRFGMLPVVFEAPAFLATNTAAGQILAILIGWIASADVRRFRAMIWVLLVGFVIGIVSCILFMLSPSTDKATLFVLGVVYAIFALLLGYAFRKAHNTLPQWQFWIPDTELTQKEQLARFILFTFGILSLGGVFFSCALVVSGIIPFPMFIVGSNFKVGLIGAAALVAASDVRKHTQMIVALIWGNIASLAALTATLMNSLERFNFTEITIGSLTLSVRQIMFSAVALDVVVIFVLLGTLTLIYKTLYEAIPFFGWGYYRAMEASADSLIAAPDEQNEGVPPYKIAEKTGRYLASFESKRVRLAKMAVIALDLFPLLWMRPPLSYTAPEDRDNFITAWFKDQKYKEIWLYYPAAGVLWLVNALLLLGRRRSLREMGSTLGLSDLIEAVFRFNSQLAYVGYYSDKEVWKEVMADGQKGLGYVPFSERPKNFTPTRIPHHAPLQVKTPDVVARDNLEEMEADVVIIGSGAAGAILAEELLKKGRRVVMLERGVYMPPEQFSEDEVQMISQLYNDGALQMSQSMRFNILQGSCVGGTTVVNNAVSFKTPPRVVAQWDAIDATKFFAAQTHIESRMRINPITAGTRSPLEGGVLNHGDHGAINEGVRRYFAKYPQTHDYSVVRANIVDCLGCGYCNIGCKYGRKLSMLDEVLPAAQAQYGADCFQIFSQAEVTQLKHDGQHVSEVIATIGAKDKKRALRIKNPKTVIVSAGAISSSWLLKESGIGPHLPVGKGLCFNMGSPIYGWFGRKLNSYDGLQIGHYLCIDSRAADFVFETWYNPPVAQALAMPGWLDTHFANMRRYDEIAAVGVLVGTEPTAYLTRALLTGGPEVVYQPSQADLTKLVDALIIMGNILFEGGAKEVFASTTRYQSYTKGFCQQTSDLDKLRELIQTDRDILLGTGHPQGGNAIGKVVDREFRVFGFDNLYVCDASVFPTATTVNPQLSVMTMAKYAADCIPN